MFNNKANNRVNSMQRISNKLLSSQVTVPIAFHNVHDAKEIGITRDGKKPSKMNHVNFAESLPLRLSSFHFVIAPVKDFCRKAFENKTGKCLWISQKVDRSFTRRNCVQWGDKLTSRLRKENAINIFGDGLTSAVGSRAMWGRQFAFLGH